MRITDAVAEVQTVSGEAEIIVVHIDVEARAKKNLPQRMFEYYGLLRLLHAKPVLPITMVLLPNASNDEKVEAVGWQTYTEKLWGRTLVRFHYGQVGIRDLASDDYLALNDPVAATLAALMKHEREEQAKVKLQSLQTVISSKLTEGDKLFLVNLIETYLPMGEIYPAEEEIMLPLTDAELSWQERIEEAAALKGREEGREEGKHEFVLFLLQSKFKTIPDDYVKRIKIIADDETLGKIALQIPSASSLADLKLPNLEENSKT